jgi:hypothetical protein
MSRKLAVFVPAVLAIIVAPARADTVRLTEGDTLHGKILSVDAKEVKLQNKALGTLTIARDHVQVIAFGDAPLEAPSAAHDGSSGRGKASPAANAFDQYLRSRGVDPKVFAEHGGLPGSQLPPGSGAAAPSGTPQDAVGQLKGLDPALTKQLQQTFPLMATPSVQKYFNDTVGGLITGNINVQDVRKQAIAVRKQIDDLEKDLGPEAKAALAPYSGILDHFIRETAPPTQGSPESAPQPGAAKRPKSNAGPSPRSGR